MHLGAELIRRKDERQQQARGGRPGKRLTPRDRYKLDLAESMGWPLAAVNDLSEYELTLWMVRGPLWPRRIELLLIQMTNVLAQVNGNKTRMSDFDMFNKRRDDILHEAANDIGMIAGAGVRRLGMGRK